MGQSKAKMTKFRCKVCSFRTTGPSKLSQHYQENPSHRPTRGGSAGKASPLPQVRGVKRKAKINFCPQCGLDLGGYQ